MCVFYLRLYSNFCTKHEKLQSLFKNLTKFTQYNPHPENEECLECIRLAIEQCKTVPKIDGHYINCDWYLSDGQWGPDNCDCGIEEDCDIFSAVTSHSFLGRYILWTIKGEEK